MAQSPVILAGSGQDSAQTGGPAGEAGAASAGETETALAAADDAADTLSPAVETADTEDNTATAPDTIRIWGTVLGVEDGMIRIDNQSGVSFAGEIVLNIADGYSRVLDGENGYPVTLSDLQAGEVIYAYIGPAMTMSLPPMTNAEMVVCKIPADAKTPDYVHVKAMEEQQDGSWVLTASDETVYQVPADCEILPYLTRNIVRLTDVTDGSHCLIWSDGSANVHKIVLFAEE